MAESSYQLKATAGRVLTTDMMNNQKDFKKIVFPENGATGVYRPSVTPVPKAGGIPSFSVHALTMMVMMMMMMVVSTCGMCVYVHRTGSTC